MGSTLGLMARKRYTEEQIIGVLNEAEAGGKTGEVLGGPH